MKRSEITEDYIKSNISRIFRQKKYVFYLEPYYLNIFGVRLELNTDKFDDVICVVYSDKDKKTHIHIWDATTDPGTKYLKSPINKDGTAILVPGQVLNGWKKGPHGTLKYTALRQSKTVKVYRDLDEDTIHDLDPKTIQEGVFFINIHRAEKWKTRSSIGPYSAGCQVIQDNKNFDTLMDLVDLSIEKTKVDSFTYTLFTKTDLIN